MPNPSSRNVIKLELEPTFQAQLELELVLNVIEPSLGKLSSAWLVCNSNLGSRVLSPVNSADQN